MVKLEDILPGVVLGASVVSIKMEVSNCDEVLKQFFANQ